MLHNRHFVTPLCSVFRPVGWKREFLQHDILSRLCSCITFNNQFMPIKVSFIKYKKNHDSLPQFNLNKFPVISVLLKINTRTISGQRYTICVERKKDMPIFKTFLFDSHYPEKSTSFNFACLNKNKIRKDHLCRLA